MGVLVDPLEPVEEGGTLGVPIDPPCVEVDPVFPVLLEVGVVGTPLGGVEGTLEGVDGTLGGVDGILGGVDGTLGLDGV